MSEEREVVNKELLGDDDFKPCALCEIPKPKTELILVSSETLGHAGGGNADICTDCFRGLQRGDVEPVGDPEF